MRLENSFEVPASVERVWSYILDVEKVVPCMPGAELTETVDDRNWKGKLTIKVGPVTLSFAGKVTLEERDDAAHRVVLKASGMEQRGKGAASATVTSILDDGNGATRVVIVQDLNVQGQAAQVSRGMMPDISAKLTRQFADCIRENLEVERSAAPGERPQARSAEPVKGLSLAFGALGGAIRRFLRRVFGRT